MSTAEQGLQKTTAWLDAMDKALKKNVAVGLPKEKVGGAVYGPGQTIFLIGARHEYGWGNNPRRSFLRMPFDKKRDEMAKFISKQFEAVAGGKPVDQALGLVGVKAQNIILDAFKTGGFGTWLENKEATKRAKGSGATLIDTGILKGAITWIVRD